MLKKNKNLQTDQNLAAYLEMVRGNQRRMTARESWTEHANQKQHMKKDKSLCLVLRVGNIIFIYIPNSFIIFKITHRKYIKWTISILKKGEIEDVKML